VHPIVRHPGDARVVHSLKVRPHPWAILEEPEDEDKDKRMQEDSCERGKALGRRNPRSQDAPDALEGQGTGQQSKEEEEGNHLLIVSRISEMVVVGR
jgi:hypothetical protein